MTFLPPGEVNSQGVRRPARMRRMPAFPDSAVDQKFRYKVQDQFLGGNSIRTTLATAVDREVALSAFEAACNAHPGRRIVLLDASREIKSQEVDLGRMEEHSRRRAGLAPRPSKAQGTE